MTAEFEVVRVNRTAILALRERVLSSPTARVGALTQDFDRETRHWAALAAGEVVGCVSVMLRRGYVLRGMAVSPCYQRQGVGAAMMRVVCAEVLAPMWCNARLEVVGFYARMGWSAVGPAFDIGDRGPHQRMTWAGPGDSAIRLRPSTT
jgi:GNAT superfamily N-acetyltransferase